MSTEFNVAPPMDTHFNDAVNNVKITPEQTHDVAIHPTQNQNIEIKQNPDLLAQVENAALLEQIQPQVSGLGADIFGACCATLEKAVRPVEETIAPPANLPREPEAPQMKYTPPEPGMAGPGGMMA